MMIAAVNVHPLDAETIRFRAAGSNFIEMCLFNNSNLEC